MSVPVTGGHGFTGFNGLCQLVNQSHVVVYLDVIDPWPPTRPGDLCRRSR